MADYKCINCGNIKESNEPCNCPLCGYKMYEVPFDQEDILKKEIKGFLLAQKVKTITRDDLELFRTEQNKKGKKVIVNKSSDDSSRFPSLDKIKAYISYVDKTELFLERVNTTVSQIKEYIHCPYSQQYEGKIKDLDLIYSQLDDTLLSAFKELGVDFSLPKKEDFSFKLNYSEKVDDSKVIIADKILNDLELLANKIKRFIRSNNIYGFSYSDILSYSIKKEIDLNDCANKLIEVLNKKYEIDIFDDGYKQLKEMIRTLWNSIYAVMRSEILHKEYSFSLNDISFSNEESFYNELTDLVNKRYIKVDEIVSSVDFLGNISEQQLFAYYDKMIEIDSGSYFKLNKSELLKIGSSEKKLNEMIGLSSIKEMILKIKAYSLANKDSSSLNLNMCFLGNPGTGKTEVARCIAGILHENKILPTNNVIEVDRNGLVSEYFGATTAKTSEVIAEAMGGVLFIDEAYSLANNSCSSITDYGKEAIDTLVKAMEDYRGKFCVIFAGYKNEMNKMMSLNPGFRSRIQFVLDFPNYSKEELRDITKLMLNKRNYTASEVVLDKIIDITEIKRKETNFANAREIRNILDQVIMCQNVRVLNSNDKEIGLVDINKYISDANIKLPLTNDSKLLTGEEQLEELVGLANVKRMVKKIKAYAKKNKDASDFNLHMCFYGNPGTGKTEVARIISRILYDAKVLNEAKLIETDSHGLLGNYVGQTAPKTEAIINDALNGVLFIDEAYGLLSSKDASGKATNYGQEALTVLLKQMEDKRGQFVVVFAGYRKEMESLLASNPGLRSRIQFIIDFPDYSREELKQIAYVFLNKKKYTIDEEALELILDITDYYSSLADFANARTLRNIIDQVIMNQNLRTDDEVDDHNIIIDDVKDYLSDENLVID